LKSSSCLRVIVAATLSVLPVVSCTNADVEFSTISRAGSEPMPQAGTSGHQPGAAGNAQAGFGATLADAGMAGVLGDAGEAGTTTNGGASGSGHGGMPGAGAEQGGNAGRSGGGAGGGTSGAGGGAGASGAGASGAGAGAGAGGGGAGTGGAGASGAGASGAGASGAGASGGGVAGVGGNAAGAAGGGGSGGGAGSTAAGAGGMAGAPVCGNHVLEKGEQCDDGNSKSGDACDATCGFEQSQRANVFVQRFVTSSFCPNNAFGAAFVDAGLSALQAILDQRVANGSLSLLLAFRGLSDLSGTSNESLKLGLAYGAPSVAANYDGKSDLDWWYTPAPGQLDSNGALSSSSTATLAAGVLNATPGTIQLPLLSEVPITLSSVKLRLTIGATSEPLASSGLAPGHLASEHLRPGLVSFASAGPPPGANPGQLCGNLGAASLAAVAIPAAFAIGGASQCSEGYAATRSLLALLVGGCTVSGDRLVSATQPDQVDTSAPEGGAGAPYKFTTNAISHAVTGCRDKNNAAVPLTTCLNAAAYSSVYRLTTGRVIIK